MNTIIDKKKLRAAIKEVNANRKNPKTFGEPPPLFVAGENSVNPARRPYWEEVHAYRNANSAERATLLYSLMAHSRGKQHIQKEWVPTYLADGSQKLVTRTLEDQEKLVAGVLKEFEAEVAWVVYEVVGFPGPKLAGPYKASEVQGQFEDIRGYENVYNARITTSVPPSLRPSEPAAGAAAAPTDGVRSPEPAAV